MDCREVRDLLRKGALAPGAAGDAGAHASGCEACASLLAADGALARELALEPAPVLDVGRLLASVESSVTAERGPLAWARSRPTWLVRALVLAAAVPLAALFLARAGLRADLASYPAWQMAVALASFLGYALWSLGTATRPLYRPQPSATAARLRAALGVATGFAVALLPVAHEAGSSPTTLHCYLSGLALGSPVLAVALLVRRHASLGGALLFAVAAGLISNATIQLVCSAVDHSHLVLGHATVGLTFALVVLAATGIGTAPRARPASLVLALALAGLGSASARADDAKPARAGKGSTSEKKVALLELYSSQGCSSCPAAEAFVGELTKKGFPRDRVVPAAFHVDYWDRLGWKDPFSSERWTERQKAVARALRQDSYYTPELVWDGRGHSSDGADATAGLKRALATKARAALSLEAELGADRLAVRGYASPAKGDRLEAGLRIEVLVLEDDLTTEVPRGENAGRTLVETAVVRDLLLARTLEKASREPVAFEASFTVPDGWKRDSLHVAATLADPTSALVWQALDVALVASSR